MNHRDHEKLLQEILPPEDMNNFRTISLEAGLAGLRRQRRRRSFIRSSAVAVALLVLSVGLFFRLHNPSRHEAARAQSLPQTPPLNLASSHIEFINDEQLLEQLRAYTNLTAALIGKPGDQRVVYLGKSDDLSAQDSN